MRRPKNIDAELEALAARTRALKARKVVQLGELVIATGAETLEIEVLSGALLAAVASSDARQLAAWRERGAAFFRQSGGRDGPAAANAPSAAQARRPDAAG
jgi:hypothetical protein